MGDIELKNKFSLLQDKDKNLGDEINTAPTLSSEIGERKRKTLPSLDSDESGSPISKKLNQIDSDSSFDYTSPRPEKMTVEEKLDSMQRRLSSLATSEELTQLRENFRSTLCEEIGKLTREIDHMQSTFKEQIENVEGRLLEAEIKIEKTETENRHLRHDLNTLRSEMNQTKSDLNDHQQYQRRWNLRVFNVPQTLDETAEQTTAKLCDIFTNLVGVRTTPEDIEVAHRVGPAGVAAGPAPSGAQAVSETAGSEGAGDAGNVGDQMEGVSEGSNVSNDNVIRKPSAVIVRFKFRGKRDQIIRQRRNLKKKNSNVSICEDLTKYNLDVCNSAYKHPATDSSWSVNGKIFCKLKSNGHKLRIPYGVDVHRFISMKAGQ